MKKYIFHFLKLIKSLIIRPAKTIYWLKIDLKKDLYARKYESKIYKKVWCAGLPKSGTTLIENIFHQLPYVQQNYSLIRIFDNHNLKDVHGVNSNMFKKMPDKLFTFFKTHTHYDTAYEKLALKYNVKIIISVRDLRDMLISRYFHIINDPNHWLHSKLVKLNFNDGFILSMNSKFNLISDNSLTYYYNWIKNWINIAKKKNYLLLWFEEYKKDPHLYINRILDYIQFNEFFAEDIQYNLELVRKNPKPLNISLSEYGRNKSTFRQGNVGDWKKYFDEEVSNFFYSNLPDKIDKILFENNK